MNCEPFRKYCLINLFKKLVRFFIPPLCPLCSIRKPAKADLICGVCRKRLPELPEAQCTKCGGTNDTILNCCSECLDSKFNWRQGLTLWKYEGIIREALHGYKYKGDLGVVDFFALEMVAKLQKNKCTEFDCVTWIPLHFTRKFMRGYNQSELLAKRICEQLNLPCKKLIDRVKCTRQQAKLKRADRLKNMKNAFRINRKNCSMIEGQSILLLDDVFTTGTTLSTVAEILMNCGAESVTVISIARG
jgi:ComF family protein